MSYGPVVTYSAPVASFATSSSAVDLSKSWSNTYLSVPTMTSSTEIYIQASADGTTFRRVYHPQQASSTPVPVTFIVNSGLTNSIVPIPNGFRYLKVETSAVVSFTASFQIICAD